MNTEERSVLASALSSLSIIEPDIHVCGTPANGVPFDYDVLGRVIMGKRLLAELIGTPQFHMLPGEYYDAESTPEDLMNFTPSIRSEEGQPLNIKEKEWLRRVVLPTLSHICGLTDADDATLRCIKRRVAEVSGHHDLNCFRLMGEGTVQPLYFKTYAPDLD